jgi:hypothetical protein
MRHEQADVSYAGCHIDQLELAIVRVRTLDLEKQHVRNLTESFAAAECRYIKHAFNDRVHLVFSKMSNLGSCVGICMAATMLLFWVLLFGDFPYFEHQAGRIVGSIANLLGRRCLLIREASRKETLRDEGR